MFDQLMGGGGQQGALDPERRRMMAQALAGNSPMAPIVQAMAYRQQMAAKPQMVSPGTAANGGWSTSLEPTGGGGGLLSQLRSLFASGGAG